MSSGLPIGHEKYKPYVCDPTKAIAKFGDVNFIDYGGQLLMPGASEDDQPYLEVIVEPCDDECEHGDFKPDAKWTVYRVEPEQLKVVEVDRRVYLVCKSYESPSWPHPVATYDEWFHHDLSSVADSMDFEMSELRAGFCSDDPIVRAQSYICLAGYHGWHEFDSYPLSLTMHEVHQRYGMSAECECPLCERCMICGEQKGAAQLDEDGHCLACCAVEEEN